MTMKKLLTILLLVPAFTGQAPAGSSADARQQALARMGELNGVALACRYYDQSKRIKGALIEGLPKQRELGQAFDDRTNESFLAFVKSARPCPSPAAFSEEVGRAIEALNKAYAAGGE